MDVYTAIRTRRSIRAYQQAPVEEEKIQRVLEAGRLAPSANNRQEWRFVVVRDEQTRHELAGAAHGQRFVGDAPVVIVICTDDTDHMMPCGHLSYPIDLAIAADHMTLVAHEQGLGTCWIGAFDENRVKEILAIPDHMRVPILFPLGYAAVPGNDRGRKPLDALVHWERYSS